MRSSIDTCVGSSLMLAACTVFALGHDSPRRLTVGQRFVAVTALLADRSWEAPDQRHASSSPGPGATSLVPGRPVPGRLTGSAPFGGVGEKRVHTLG
jgi:hypothetical protein